MGRTFVGGLRIGVLAACVAMGAAHRAAAHGAFPQDVPIDRVVANLEASLKARPNDPEAYYRLGRAHTLALETKSGFVPVFENGDQMVPVAGAFASRRFRGEPPKTTETREQLLAHLKAAVTNLNKAIALRPTAPHYRLTLACALEAGESMAGDVDVWPLCPVAGAADITLDRGGSSMEWIRSRIENLPKAPKAMEELLRDLAQNSWQFGFRDTVMTVAYSLRSRPELAESLKALRLADWHELIEDQFFTAMCYALPTNGRADSLPIWGGPEDWVAYEAAKDFVRLLGARKAQPTDAVRLKVAQATVKAFDELPPPNAITPLIFDPAGRPLQELTIDTPTAFDLDGSGRPQRYRWVKPTVGILAWDPERTGRITSGRQLFGSVSWWIFFDHGYQALDTLDDDRDGMVRGAELNGIVVWTDRDSDGVSDPGEVITAQEAGIEWLSVQATGTTGRSPCNLHGIGLAGGRVVPSYDWIATGVEASSPATKPVQP